MQKYGRHERQSAEILLFDYNDSLVYKGSLKELPLKDDLVRRLCIQFFNDPEPCNAHRSAAAGRILFEFEDRLRYCSGGRNMTISVDYLSTEFREILSGDRDVSMVQFAWPAVQAVSEGFSVASDGL